VTGSTLDPGLHFVTPIVNTVDQVDTRVKAIRIEGYTAASREQQDLFLDATLNYHVDPRRAPDIIQNLGVDFENTIIMPRFLDIPKSVTDDYPTAVVLNSRDEIRVKATELLRAELGSRGIIVDQINFENFSYSDAYNQAIEDKQVAQQQVETERQRLAQQEIIAQQKVAAARGDADSQIERARGEAESNRLVAASLTDAILQNRYIERLSDQIQVMLVPSDGGPLILDLGQLLPSPAPQ
jgi:regulator of protease activity HflC (stomatin/prohibitin superfamily)